jgi:hypothetical protein
MEAQERAEEQVAFTPPVAHQRAETSCREQSSFPMVLPAGSLAAAAEDDADGEDNVEAALEPSECIELLVHSPRVDGQLGILVDAIKTTAVRWCPCFTKAISVTHPLILFPSFFRALWLALPIYPHLSLRRSQTWSRSLLLCADCCCFFTPPSTPPHTSARSVFCLESAMSSCQSTESALRALPMTRRWPC